MMWISIFKLVVIFGICYWNKAEGITRNLSEDAINDINHFIEVTLQCRHIPGMAVTVVNKDKVLLQRGYGLADLESQTPVNETTLFPIASTTKAFTTAVLAMLLAKTSFSWDTPLKQIDPKFKLHTEMLTEHVTLRDILTHRTGIPGYFVSLMAGYPETMSREEFVRLFHFHPPIHNFRTQLQYNNFMYALAGFIAEVLGNKKWEDLIRENIFKPLNMSSSTFVSEMDISQKSIHLAKPYVYFNSTNVAVDLSTLRQVEKASPAGAIISNAKDMGAWLQFHLRHGQLPNGQSLLSKTKIEEMYETPLGGHAIFPPDLVRPIFPVSDVSSTYALAWINNIYRGYRRIWHSGGILSYKTQVWLLPELESGIFIVANGPLTEKWPMVNIGMYITDHLANETPWLDTNTACTFPAPWQPEETVVEALPYADDTTPHPQEFYVGKYRNIAFGEITILRNDSTQKLQMKMGQFIEAELMYDAKKKAFFTKLVNKYWYLKDRMPLEFKNLKTVDATRVFTSIHMPLYAPYEQAFKLEFKKDLNSSPRSTVLNCGVKHTCTLNIIYLSQFLLIVYTMLCTYN